MAAESLFTVCGLAISEWLAGGGSHDVDWQRSEFFLKGWVPPLWGMSPHRGVKKRF